jgi:hypothetical protein
MIIIVPYRDREKHLEYFINKYYPELKKLIPDVKIYIIEQDEDKLFNRGKLLNVGYTIAMNDNDLNNDSDLDTNNPEYIIMHDIDLIPNEKIINKYYKMTEYDVIRILNGHTRSLGGIIKIRTDAFSKINGFPNNIWGWGVEDRALFYRACIYKLTMNTDRNIVNNKAHLANFTVLNHKMSRHTKNKELLELENKVFKEYTYDEQLEYISKSGINNLDYEILNCSCVNNDIKIIKVKI